MTPARKRLIGTSVLCASASALFVGPQVLVPGGETSPLLVFAGVTIPAGVAALYWACMRKDFVALDTRRRHVPQPEPKLREDIQ
jgi:hypothetical protein